jgi:hypothetical protein
MATYSGMWNKSYEKFNRKFGIRFPYVSGLSESSMSRVEWGHFQNLLKHVERYNMYYTLCEEITVIKFSVYLGGLQLNSTY